MCESGQMFVGHRKMEINQKRENRKTNYQKEREYYRERKKGGTIEKERKRDREKERQRKNEREREKKIEKERGQKYILCASERGRNLSIKNSDI
jgi:hypothetical protein